MLTTSIRAIAYVSLVALAACSGQSETRESIHAVGSSTVYPFATVAGERFAEASGSKTPRIESIGTGGGFEQFCAGIGLDTPDISNASRRMTVSEFDKCTANGVTDIVEVEIGIDGIALGHKKDGSRLTLTAQDIYEALAANPYGKPNTAKLWSDVNPKLPAEKIAVFGPPSTSGTYDAFKSLILKKGCNSKTEMQELKSADKAKHKAICETLRGAPFYVEQGENDNLIISKIGTNPGNLGIFGFSYLDENRDKVSAVALESVAPSYDTIADGSYIGARPLFIYLKKANAAYIPEIQAYAEEILKGSQRGGYLGAKGLISSPETVAKQAADNVTNMTTLTRKELEQPAGAR